MENNKQNFKVNPKDAMSPEEMKKVLHIPPRDEKRYPMPTKEQMVEAGDFMFKLNLMASSVDENLQSLVWSLYMKLDDFLRKGLSGSSLELAKTLEELRVYIDNSQNPILTDSVIKTDNS